MGEEGVWRVWFVKCVCGECVWRMCVESVCGECVWRVCVENVCGECVWRVCVENVCGGFTEDNKPALVSMHLKPVLEFQYLLSVA